MQTDQVTKLIRPRGKNPTVWTDPSHLTICDKEALFLLDSILLVSLETTRRRNARVKVWKPDGQRNNKSDCKVRSNPEKWLDSDPVAVILTVPLTA
jgi:hypothetical protein